MTFAHPQMTVLQLSRIGLLYLEFDVSSWICRQDHSNGGHNPDGIHPDLPTWTLSSKVMQQQHQGTVHLR